jgi:hypothetical protein
MSIHSSSDAPTFFAFEADFVDSLRCIPMQVRYKLDTVGVKLSLQHWHQFSQGERAALVERPCDSPADQQTYRTHLQDLVSRHTGAPAKTLPIDEKPAWLRGTVMPEAVNQQAQTCGINLTLQQWTDLTPLQRFALIKLSRPGHENRNFSPALQEFGLS